MKIDPSKVAGIYESNASKGISKSNNDIKNDITPSRDRIELSKTGMKYNEISSLKSKVINDIDKGTDVAKIQSLKAAIKSGTYHISSVDIAGAMLKK